MSLLVLQVGDQFTEVKGGGGHYNCSEWPVLFSSPTAPPTATHIAGPPPTGDKGTQTASVHMISPSNDRYCIERREAVSTVSPHTAHPLHTHTLHHPLHIHCTTHSTHTLHHPSGWYTSPTDTVLPERSSQRQQPKPSVSPCLWWVHVLLLTYRVVVQL